MAGRMWRTQQRLPGPPTPDTAPAWGNESLRAACLSGYLCVSEFACTYVHVGPHIDMYRRPDMPVQLVSEWQGCRSRRNEDITMSAVIEGPPDADRRHRHTVHVCTIARHSAALGLHRSRQRRKMIMTAVSHYPAGSN